MHPQLSEVEAATNRNSASPIKRTIVGISSHWGKLFVMSCVFAVLLDPLFLYIPIINHDIKCLGIDMKLNKTAIGLRSITYFSYLLDIIFQVYMFERIRQSYILIDILAILPLPQGPKSLVKEVHAKENGPRLERIVRLFAMVRIICLIVLCPDGNSRFLSKSKGIHIFHHELFGSTAILATVLRIYFSCKDLNESHQGEFGSWVKGVLNFFLYILASHVVGALWYFFGIQRMTTCWQSACRIENGCDPSTIDCVNQSTNSTLLNHLCPINPSDATIYNFGIFLEVLQSHISGSRNLPQKFSYCFWWGLRNLSSLGSNLQTSINTWENLFAVSISVIGLLLFLYLIGNLQAYMQLDSARREEHEHKMKIERKLEEKGPEIESWLSLYSPFIPASSKENVKSQIMRKIKQEVEGNRDVDVEDILFILPSELQRYIQNFTTLAKLKTAPKLKNMGEEVLQAINEHLKPKSYTANSYIIREEEPLEMMMLIMAGTIKIESSCNGSASSIGVTGDLCGEELVDWISDPLFPTVLPLSTITVQAMNNVDAKILTAGDLYTVVSLFGEHFSKRLITPPPDHVRFDRLGLGKLPQV